MTDTNKLGKRVAKYREGLELTQEQLATNAGLDVGYIRAAGNQRRPRRRIHKRR